MPNREKVLFSLLVEKVILIIALLVFSMEKHKQCKEQFNCTEHGRDWGDNCHKKSKDVLIPKLKQPLVALVFGMKEGVFIPGLGFYLRDRSGAIYFPFCTKSDFEFFFPNLPLSYHFYKLFISPQM